MWRLACRIVASLWGTSRGTAVSHPWGVGGGDPGDPGVSEIKGVRKEWDFSAPSSAQLCPTLLRGQTKQEQEKLMRFTSWNAGCFVSAWNHFPHLIQFLFPEISQGSFLDHILSFGGCTFLGPICICPTLYSSPKKSLISESHLLMVTSPWRDVSHPSLGYLNPSVCNYNDYFCFQTHFSCIWELIFSFVSV